MFILLSLAWWLIFKFWPTKCGQTKSRVGLACVVIVLLRVIAVTVNYVRNVNLAVLFWLESLMFAFQTIPDIHMQKYNNKGNNNVLYYQIRDTAFMMCKISTAEVDLLLVASGNVDCFQHLVNRICWRRLARSVTVWRLHWKWVMSPKWVIRHEEIPGR